MGNSGKYKIAYPVRNGLSNPIVKSAIAGMSQLPAFKKRSNPNGYFLPSMFSHQGEDLSPELILQKLPNCIYSLNNDGVWNQISAGSDRYLRSIDTDDFVKWVNEIVHIQDRVTVMKAVSDCRSGEQNTSAEFRLINDPNTQHMPQWLEINCLSASSNQLILTVLRDISERKSFEKIMNDERRSADEANLAKTKFLANMSHELRTPLNAIIGFSEILKSGMIPDSELEKQHEYQHLINESAQHLLNVLNDILDMSKIEAGKYDIFPEDIDLTKIASSCCSMMMPLADNAGVEICLENPDEPLRLEADSKALRQILLNLMSNAIKFNSPGTIVRISANRVGRNVELRISDQGLGITPDSIKRLGEPFHQIDNEKTRKHEGTGLGLSIVKGLVHLHHGAIRFESTLDVGTTVIIQLPLSHGISRPVPCQEVDVVIKIKPDTNPSCKLELSKSRLAG